MRLVAATTCHSRCKTGERGISAISVEVLALRTPDAGEHSACQGADGCVALTQDPFGVTQNRRGSSSACRLADASRRRLQRVALTPWAAFAQQPRPVAVPLEQRHGVVRLERSAQAQPTCPPWRPPRGAALLRWTIPAGSLLQDLRGWRPCEGGDRSLGALDPLIPGQVAVGRGDPVDDLVADAVVGSGGHGPRPQPRLRCSKPGPAHADRARWSLGLDGGIPPLSAGWRAG